MILKLAKKHPRNSLGCLETDLKSILGFLYQRIYLRLKRIDQPCFLFQRRDFLLLYFDSVLQLEQASPRDLLPTAKAGGFLPPAESFLLHRPDLTQYTRH